jgi:hypothetical protein
VLIDGKERAKNATSKDYARWFFYYTRAKR